MYLANTTRPDINFSVNVLARHNSAPTRRHLNGIKHILQYLKGTTNMSLFYDNDCSPDFFGYANAGYLSDPHKVQSKLCYVFTCGGTAISWQSTKQSIVATSSNHVDIIAIHEESQECLPKTTELKPLEGDEDVSLSVDPSVMGQSGATTGEKRKRKRKRKPSISPVLSTSPRELSPIQYRGQSARARAQGAGLKEEYVQAPQRAIRQDHQGPSGRAG
ncbi:secreted RxLR effector protein 161-like [Nicotiana tomentosiformis]|uniref:secreted RxLR effector protein 161-like n=1 Tax=Nicotiana tomentosiformis TaxID=4098 RepID=UPI00388C5921